MTYWAEVTALDDIERVFVSTDGTNQRRTQPFDEVDYPGGWRVEFAPRSTGSMSGAYIAIAMSLAAIAISTTAIVMRVVVKS